jgi:hypothetical protein
MKINESVTISMSCVKYLIYKCWIIGLDLFHVLQD